MRSSDTCVLFYERGMKLLKADDRVLTYVTSNSWLKAKYGEKLRRLFTDHHSPLRLLELGKDVFESAIVDSAVLIVRSGQEAAVESFPTVDLELLPEGVTFPDLPYSVWKETRPVAASPWRVLSAAEWPILYKMEERGTPLRDWDVSIRRGVLTGLNAAFIIDDETREALIAEEPKSTEIIKPILRGRDIRRWRACPERWLIATLPSLAIDINEYPAVRRYLLSFGREKLGQTGEQLLDGTRARKKTAHMWFELQDACAYYELFEREKLFWMDMSPEGRFAVSRREVFCNDKGFVMTGTSLDYLCGVLNSKLATWYVRSTGLTTGMGVLQWKRFVVEEIPIPGLALADQRPFAMIIGRILTTLHSDAATDVSALEAELNRLVYDLYDLSDNEVRLVEESSP